MKSFKIKLSYIILVKLFVLLLIFEGVQLAGGREGGGRPPLPNFEKLKSVPVFFDLFDPSV